MIFCIVRLSEFPVFLSMEAMSSMFYIAYFMGINSANPSKNGPVFKWSNNVFTIAPADVLTRQDISSLNGDPALKTYSRQESL